MERSFPGVGLGAAAVELGTSVAPGQGSIGVCTGPYRTGGGPWGEGDADGAEQAAAQRASWTRAAGAGAEAGWEPPCRAMGPHASRCIVFNGIHTFPWTHDVANGDIETSWLHLAFVLGTGGLPRGACSPTTTLAKDRDLVGPLCLAAKVLELFQQLRGCGATLLELWCRWGAGA